jgi:hypothetical protein
MSDNMISHNNIEAFRKAYQACEGDTFTFKGQEMDKRYAMYFLQNWDENINTRGNASRNSRRSTS